MQLAAQLTGLVRLTEGGAAPGDAHPSQRRWSIGHAANATRTELNAAARSQTRRDQLRTQPGPVRRRLRSRRGGSGHHARSQWHGQVDHHQDHHGDAQAAKPEPLSLKGEAIHGWPSYRVAQTGIGLVPEQRQVFPNLSVRENLVATAVEPLRRPPHRGRLRACTSCFRACRSAAAIWRGSLGRRTADASDRPCIDDQSAPADPGRSHRRTRAAGARRHLARARTFQVGRTGDDRGGQEPRSVARAGRSPLHPGEGQVVWQGSSEALRSEPQLAHRYLGV